MERAQRKLLRGNLPMSDAALLAIASTSVLAAQTYPDEWEARTTANKTWAQWKVVYNAAHTARKRLLLASWGGEPLHAANAATAPTNFIPAQGGGTLDATTHATLDTYLDNLANAATNEATIIARLSERLDSLATQMASINTAINNLTQTNNNSNANRLNYSRNNNNNRTNYAVNGYCWTHGYKVGTTHSSTTCSNKAEGHKDNATSANTMNGSTANRGWDSNTT